MENVPSLPLIMCSNFDEDETRRLGQKIRKLNMDNSGNLSIDELMSFPGLKKNPLAPRIAEMFDPHGNGEIAFKEFTEVASQLFVKDDNESKLRFAFRIYDIDNDGYISNEELFTILKIVGSHLEPKLTDTQLQEVVDRSLQLVDKDGDGKISFQEFCDVVALYALYCPKNRKHRSKRLYSAAKKSKVAFSDIEMSAAATPENKATKSGVASSDTEVSAAATSENKATKKSKVASSGTEVSAAATPENKATKKSKVASSDTEVSAVATPEKEATVKKPGVASSHPKVSKMVNEAITNLKERKGSSLQAIKKYIDSHYVVDMYRLTPFIHKYLRNAVASGALIQTSGYGASGSFKLGASEQKSRKGVQTPTAEKKAKIAAKNTVKSKKSASPAKKAKNATDVAVKPKKSASPTKKAKNATDVAVKPKKSASPTKKAKNATKYIKEFCDVIALFDALFSSKNNLKRRSKLLPSAAKKSKVDPSNSEVSAEEAKIAVKNTVKPRKISAPAKKAKIAIKKTVKPKSVKAAHKKMSTAKKLAAKKSS